MAYDKKVRTGITPAYIKNYISLLGGYKMKKLLATVLAAVMVLSMAACGGEAKDGKTDITMWCIAT